MKRLLTAFAVALKKRSGRLRAARTALLILSLWAAARGGDVRELPSPAGEGSGQPNLAADAAGRVYLSWIERLEGGRFALRFATRVRGGWSRPRTVAEGSGWFVNWADFPSLAALPDGSLAAHWLVRADAATSPYAYDVYVARSPDAGKSWGEPVRLNRDGTPTEHGFVSMFPAAPAATRGERTGRLAAVWLDGRETKPGASHDGAGAHAQSEHGDGDMTLRYATLRAGGDAFEVESETLLDGRVCECCQTSAALTSEGPVVVYRDRSDTEVRDISVVRLRGGRWTQPATVHPDGWRLDSCPVNGPSVAAHGKRVAVAWFTMGSDERPRVRLAFSRDAGATFGPAVEVSDGDPVGRADVLLLDGGDAVVSWIERDAGGKGAEVRVRRVSSDGRRGPSLAVAPSGAARSSGFPQMIRSGAALVFAWPGARRVLTSELRVADLPRSFQPSEARRARR